MKSISRFILIIALLSAITSIRGQYTLFTPPGAFAIEVSLENSDLPRLPMYRNSISSLVVSGDLIIGGTTTSDGSAPFIFTASLARKEVIEIFDLTEIISGQVSIRSGFTRWKDNFLVAGTIPSDKGDGHLLQITVDAENNIACKDLGVPVKGEGIFSLVPERKGELIYGLTYPSGFFFSYNPGTGISKVYKDITPSKKDIAQIAHFGLKPENYLSRALISDSNGRIFGSMPVNRIFMFNPREEKFTIYDNAIPFVWGREVLGQADAWAVSEDGKIYGGNAGDGQLFELNPETGKTRNLGKPCMMPRIRGLAFGSDGKLYGLSGGAPGYSHLFTWDKTDGFYDYGNPEFIMQIEDVESGILWRGFQLGTIAASEDGKYIVIGEDEALSQLMVLPVK